MDNQPSQTTNTAELTSKIDTEEPTKKDGEKPSTTTDPAEFTQDYNKTIYQYKNGELTGTYTVGELIKAPYGKSDMLVLYDSIDTKKIMKLEDGSLKINENYTGNGYSFKQKPENQENTGGKRRQTKKSRRTRKTKRRLRKISKK